MHAWEPAYSLLCFISFSTIAVFLDFKIAVEDAVSANSVKQVEQAKNKVITADFLYIMITFQQSFEKEYYPAFQMLLCLLIMALIPQVEHSSVSSDFAVC